MLPKITYSKVVQGLRRIKKNWDEDRVENPGQVPYCIKSELERLIKRACYETDVWHQTKTTEETIDYLHKTGQVMKTDLGVMFKLPEGHAPLPTQAEFKQQVLKEMADNAFFGKTNVPREYND